MRLLGQMRYPARMRRSMRAAVSRQNALTGSMFHGVSSSASTGSQTVKWTRPLGWVMPVRMLRMSSPGFFS